MEMKMYHSREQDAGKLVQELLDRTTGTYHYDTPEGITGFVLEIAVDGLADVIRPILDRMEYGMTTVADAMTMARVLALLLTELYL